MARYGATHLETEAEAEESLREFHSRLAKDT